MTVLCITASDGYHVANYNDTMQRLCRDVEIFSYGPNMVSQFWGPDGARVRAEVNARLRSRIRALAAEGRLDVVFCCAYDDLFELETLRLLRRRGALLVNHMVDMPTQWYRLLRTAPFFDCIAIAHCDFHEHLGRVARDLLYLPMAASPAVYRPVPLRDRPAPLLSFVGSYTPVRAALLAPLQRRFPELEVYGNWAPDLTTKLSWHKRAREFTSYSWPRLRAERLSFPVRFVRHALATARATRSRDLPTTRGTLDLEQMVATFSSSLISLGITQSEGRVDSPHAPRWVRGRDFEVTMSGGFYLVQRAPEHAWHFKLGEEIETWENVDELLDKIGYYLAHPDRARAVAANGRRRALAEHTWEIRMRTLFRHLGCEREFKPSAGDAPPLTAVSGSAAP